jgi:hypothetical protein
MNQGFTVEEWAEYNKPAVVKARQQNEEYIMKTCKEDMEKVFDEQTGKTNCRKKCKKGTLRNKKNGRRIGKCIKKEVVNLGSRDFHALGNYIVEEVEGKFYKCTKDPSNHIEGVLEVIYLPDVGNGIASWRH